MGGKSSVEVRNVINNNMMYKSQLESISKSMTNVNTKVQNAINQAAENYIELKKKMNLTGTSIVADGGTVNIGQTTKGTVTLTSTQMSEIINTITQDIAAEIEETVLNNVDIEALTELANKAESSVQNSSTNISGAGRNDKTKINNTVNTDIDVEIVQKIENYIENVVATCVNNFSDKYCGTKFLSSSEFELQNGQIVAKNEGTVNLTQADTVTVTSTCSQVDKINNDIIIALASGVGIELDNEIKMITSTSADNSASQTLDNKGLGDDIADAVKGVGSAIGSIFSSTYTIIAIIGCVICCVILLAVGGLAFIMTDETGSQTLQGLANTASSTALEAAKMSPQGKLASIVGGCGYGVSMFDRIMTKLH